MKLLNAGKLKNLNDLVVGASVLIANGNVGFVTSITDVVHINFDHEKGIGDIGEARLWIDIPQGGFMSMKHRRDGRSHHDAEYDIVSVCRPENTKVKGIKVWSHQTLTPELIKAGNDFGLVCRLYIDTERNGRSWVGNKKPAVLGEVRGTCKLGKSGVVSVKVWKE